MGGFLRPSVWRCLFHPSYSFLGNSRTVCPLLTLQRQAGCRQPVGALRAVPHAQVVCRLSVPQSWPCFLRILAGILQSPTLAAVRGAHGELPRCGCVGEVYRAFGVPVGQLGRLTWEGPQRLIFRLSDGICEVANRVCIPSMPFESPSSSLPGRKGMSTGALAAVLSSGPCPHSCSSAQYPRWGRKAAAPLVVSCTAARAGSSPTCSHSPLPPPHPPERSQATEGPSGAEPCRLT